MSSYWRAPLRHEPGREKAWSETPEFHAEWERERAARRKARIRISAMERHLRRLKWLAVTKAMQRGEESS